MGERGKTELNVTSDLRDKAKYRWTGLTLSDQFISNFDHGLHEGGKAENLDVGE